MVCESKTAELLLMLKEVEWFLVGDHEDLEVASAGEDTPNRPLRNPPLADSSKADSEEALVDEEDSVVASAATEEVMADEVVSVIKEAAALVVDKEDIKMDLHHLMPPADPVDEAAMAEDMTIDEMAMEGETNVAEQEVTETLLEDVIVDTMTETETEIEIETETASATDTAEADVTTTTDPANDTMKTTGMMTQGKSEDTDPASLICNSGATCLHHGWLVGILCSMYSHHFLGLSLGPTIPLFLRILW